MCGIVGYTGGRKVVPLLLKGLEQLEYRGYDSSGVACLRPKKDQFEITYYKEKGKLGALKKKLQKKKVEASIGIGHTRWATHGIPSSENAHPHIDEKNSIALVHNGIIENHAELKAFLKKKKVRFSSETDTEVAAQLIGYYHRKNHDMLSAFKKAMKEMEGNFSFVAFSKNNPETLYVFRRSNPLVIGIGKKECFAASDVTALLPYTRDVIYLEDDDVGVLSPKGFEVYSLHKKSKVIRRPQHIKWDVTQAQKQGHPHFMSKEMHEQPEVLKQILDEHIRKDKIHFETLSKKQIDKISKAKKAFFISCGTAFHAGLYGSYLFEKYCSVSSKVQTASEFRYSDPVINKGDLVVLITQSGETADTLAALREAKQKGAVTLAVVNVVGSTMAREANAVIYTHAGPEIGVASTKAYVAQLLNLFLLSIFFGENKKTLTAKEFSKLLKESKKIPDQAKQTLKLKNKIEKISKNYFKRKNFLYLGRGVNFPNALEGALKLKEISYAHAHGYAGGEMKHGPIALIDKDQVVICIAPQSKTFEKMISNIEEIRARGGIVISIGTEKLAKLKKLSSTIFEIPSCIEELSPILTVIPLQLFAYYVSIFNGRDVDQPRNLAKSVTVE